MPVVLAGEVVGYLWRSLTDDAADFLERAATRARGLNAAVGWIGRLREAYATGVSPSEAIRYWSQAPKDPVMGRVVPGEGGRLPGLAEVESLARDGAPPPEPAPRGPSPEEHLTGPARVDAYLAGRISGDAELAAQVRSLDEALAVRPVPEDLVAVAGLAMRAELLDRPIGRLPGTRLFVPSYLNVALGPEPPDPQLDLWLHVRGPAGTPATLLSLIAEGVADNVLLLGRGSELSVSRVVSADAIFHIVATMTPRPPGAETPRTASTTDLQTLEAPPEYPSTTPGPVISVPVTKQGIIVGFLWTAVDDDAAGFVPRYGIEGGALHLPFQEVAETMLAWEARLREARQAGIPAVEFVRSLQGVPGDPALGDVVAGSDRVYEKLRYLRSTAID